MTVQEKLDAALALHRTGELARAAALYREIVAAQPAHADAWNLLGRIALQQGDAAAALEGFSRAAAAKPQIPAFHLGRGLALRALGRGEDAIAAFRAAVRLQPALAEAHHQLGNACKAARRFDEALAPLQEAARLAPDNAGIQLNLGAALLELRRLDEAIACFRRALQLQPGRAEAHNILGHALFEQARLGEAEANWREAIRLQPGHAPALDNLGRLLKAQGRMLEAVASFRLAVASAPRPATHSNLLLALNYLALPPEEMLAEHRRWAELHEAPRVPQPQASGHDFTAGRRLRVGYVSPDFARHAVAFFIEPVLANHDRGRVEVFCYANVPAPDPVTARLRESAEHWRDIAALDDDEAAGLVRRDRIDVLVDLAGHTANNRLLLFARKPAPLQLTWLGYPNTTGMASIDHRLTDAIADPPGATEAWHTEKLLRLDGPFSVYRPPANAPAVAQPPALTNGRVTFGCFNNFAKVGPAVIDLWCELLAAVPSAHLFLKSRSLADPDTAARVRAGFARGGVAPERLEFDGNELSVVEHLALYQRVDIALDAFPYNGTTTTCEALWMGVPVVTLAGRTHVGRVGTTLLTHLGMPEWIAQAPRDYVHIGRGLAQDPARLAAVRAGLRARMAASALCDAPAFTRRLEDTLAAAWAKRCEAR